MLNSANKRFTLPFSPQKSREANYENELAAIYAFAELERAKGGGLIIKQPHEKILFISQIGYPLWLFPKNENIYVFDGLNDTNFEIPYIELPAAKIFMESLDRNSNTKEEYLNFLSANYNYFQQVEKEKKISLKGLITNADFVKELNIYRKEANEIIDKPPNLALLSPALESITISSALAEMDKLQSFFKENTDRLLECQKQIGKITSQYVTEIDYAAQAVKDEANAKIKAQEEFVNPKIANLNIIYKQQIASVTRGFNEEIEKLEKLKSKTSKSVESNEERIKLYEREAKAQAEQNHLIYEKRWKEKKNQTKKENDGLKKELKRLENSIKNLSKQRTEKTWKLQQELETEIKLARQPMLDLEKARDAKVLSFKLEAEKLYKQQKPVIDSLNNAIKLEDAVNARFESLGVREQQLKVPALFYVPFYVICYQSGSSRRYNFLAPSVTNVSSFSGKLRSAFGISKIKERFIPRFQTINASIDKTQVLIKQDTFLENQIIELGEKNNLLNTDMARNNIGKGLINLKDDGWISDREYQSLSSSLTSA
ncbi:MAG TPA: hypothetical protein VLU95_04790 [Candidatus Acidoferrum sp.]|nr:hypothetical protein [Candidatus Acidoferrum sp.]